MNDKHYNVSYLEDTFQILAGIKNHSYGDFVKIKSGTILDLGCGIGTDIKNMASMTNPEVEFIGIDHDPEMINKAIAGNMPTSNVKFLRREVFPLEFKDSSISGVRAERLFQHLIYPGRVLEEIKRVLKPSRYLTIMETDWDSLSFYNIEANLEQSIRDYFVKEKVSQGKIAKKLSLLLVKYKFKNIKLSVFPVVLKSYEDACTYFWIDKIITEMTKHGLFSNLQQKSLLEELKNANENGYFACSINMIVISGQK